MITLSTLFENNADMADKGSMLGMVGMFVLVAVAVGMFIYSGMKLERFESLEQGFQLPYALKTALQRSQALYAPTYRLALIVGVCLCVLSPTFIFATSYFNDDFAAYGVSAFLVIAATAVFLFVYYGNIQETYTKLLNEPHIDAK